MSVSIFFVSAAIILLLTIVDRGNAALPSTIRTCPRNHPNPNQCIIDAVNEVRPLLATGDLGDGYHTPALEPLSLDNIEMSRGREFQAVFSDIKANGGSNFKIEKLQSNISALAFDLVVSLPHIEFSGKYTLKLKILLFDINGHGDVRGTFNNAKGAVRMRGKKIEKNGTEYVKFDKMPLKIQVNDLKLHLDNLFGGDPLLGQVGNTIINDNQDLYLSEIIPGLERGLSKKFLEIANNILATATYDEMFPPN